MQGVKKYLNSSDERINVEPETSLGEIITRERLPASYVIGPFPGKEGGKMPKVRCAIDNKEISLKDAKWCNNCQFWLCKKHVNWGWGSKPRCPKCRKEIKR